MAAVFALPLLLAAGSWGSAPMPSPIERTGHITAWRVADDGTVALLLRGEGGADPFATWFATPPNQTSATRFEDLALRAILAVRSSGEAITVRGERRADRDGRTIAEAIELMSITAGE